MTKSARVKAVLSKALVTDENGVPVLDGKGRLLEKEGIPPKPGIQIEFPDDEIYVTDCRVELAGISEWLSTVGEQDSWHRALSQFGNEDFGLNACKKLNLLLLVVEECFFAHQWSRGADKAYSRRRSDKDALKERPKARRAAKILADYCKKYPKQMQFPVAFALQALRDNDGKVSKLPAAPKWDPRNPMPAELFSALAEQLSTERGLYPFESMMAHHNSYGALLYEAREEGEEAMPDNRMKLPSMLAWSLTVIVRSETGGEGLKPAMPMPTDCKPHFKVIEGFVEAVTGKAIDARDTVNHVAETVRWLGFENAMKF
jgi:hypothetical protein